MKYRKDIIFENLPAGRIVKGVPIDHPVFDEHENYIKPRRNKSSWKKIIKERLKNFDKKLNSEPHKYCVNCKRLEDGAHRYDLAKNYLKQKTRDIKTISICFKGIKSDLYTMFLNKIRSEKLQTKHEQWLTANAQTKWNYFNDIDFKNKNVLVIGSNIGYSVIRSIQRGALTSIGYEIDERINKIGVSLADKLNINDRVKFINKDFLRASHKPNEFDIVLCMGLIHYFKPYQYKRLLKKILDIASEKIIIELRCINSDDTNIFAKSDQTMATTGFLREFARKNNLIVENLLSRDDERWIVIYKKVK